MLCQPLDSVRVEFQGNHESERARASAVRSSRMGTVGPPPLDCVFCERLRGKDFVVANDLAMAFLDAFPLSDGHCLVVPRRHEADFLALTQEELAAVWGLVPAVRRYIEAKNVPAGYNIGINVGEAAGQTVGHAHLHVIPRHQGDVPDPRGGIRWVIPAKAAYWERR
jgi:diadenosine tetraphosphate (Ap4A) HIT family hydrolase